MQSILGIWCLIAYNLREFLSVLLYVYLCVFLRVH